jgi:hypothetical protein
MRALKELPPGHPSSPYLADGSRRPPRPSLRSLELPGEKPGPDAPLAPETRRHHYVYDLVEVSHEQASKIIEYFRSRWGAMGSRSTPESPMHQPHLKAGGRAS